MTSPRRRWFRLPRNASTLERDIEQEIAFHIEARIADLVCMGVPPAEARAHAEREFGDVDSALSELSAIDRGVLRRTRRASFVDAIWQDTRTALRRMRREPGFTLTIVLTLALGVGLNAMMFAITDRLLFSAPPHIANADDVVRVFYEHTRPSGEYTRTPVMPYPDYAVLRSVDGFDEVGAFFVSNGVIGRGLSGSEVRVGQATATLFPLLGVAPAFGRFFTPEEDAAPSGSRVVVLSYRLWQDRFGGATSVIGTMLEIDHTPYEVVGVAPRGFNGVNLERVDAWVPVSALGARFGGDDWHLQRGAHYLRIVARLRDGVDPAVVREQASAVFLADNKERFGDALSAGIMFGSVIAARAPEMTGSLARSSPQRSGRIAMLLLGVSALVVLIACVNVINLLLARSIRLRRELGVRMALGISRARLATAVLTETVLTALLGAAFGLLLVHWSSRFAGAVLPDIEWTGSLAGWHVIAFTFAVAMACAIIAAIAPALHAMRTQVTDLIGASGRVTWRRSIVRSGLIAAQAALSLLLLAGAGLFVRSLHEASELALGYDPDRVAVFAWHTSGLEWDRARALSLYDVALERVQSLPQVEAAALSMTEPLWSAFYGYIRVPRLDSIPTTRDMYFSSVSPDYFRTMGARIVQGREFTRRDIAGTTNVTIVTQSLADVLWPHESAIGQCFMTSREADAPCREVVGIVEDTKYMDVLGEPSLMYYLPLAQERVPGSLLVRLRGDHREAMAAVSTAMAGLEPGLPHVRAEMLETRAAPAFEPWRLGAAMFTAFGVLALILASFGIYGVVARDVAQRRREMGIRLALGSRAGAVLRMVLRDALRVVAFGLAAGVLVCAIAARYVEPMLLNVSAYDPAVYSAVVMLLLVVAVLAAGMPAWRAARVQPTEALRED